MSTSMDGRDVGGLGQHREVVGVLDEAAGLGRTDREDGDVDDDLLATDDDDEVDVLDDLADRVALDRLGQRRAGCRRRRAAGR